MFSVSQFYILSPRGDTIISRDFRNDVAKGTAEIFFHSVKFWKGDGGAEAPPCFNLDGVNYIFVKQNGLYFVCTTKYNVSPNFALELLARLAKLFKDYCGVLSEEAIRKNFVLIYELLDEVLDFGYPMVTSTEQLKVHVHNEPVMVDMIKQANAFKMPTMHQKTTPSSSVYKPVTLASKSGQQRNEIFVDILERLTMLFNGNGYTLSSHIDGSIVMKSYLSGNPPLRLALNEDLVVGRGSDGNSYGSVVLDDCNFHECVQLDDFESMRLLNFVPPDGEFVLMNYRVTSDFVAPFRIYPHIEENSPTQIEIVIKVRADLPQNNFGVNVQVTVPVPSRSNGVSNRLDSGAAAAGQTAEYRAKDHKVVWTIKKFQGGAEHTLRAKVDLREPMSPAIRREVGPVSVSFEIPMFNASQLQVKYLRIVEQHRTYNPHRWVRYVSQSASYVCRFSTN
mmetsp:Transcript_21717/g.42674  ORF Transcript_21717/g.42674 Transcript_21717/m.42674 type:complete len:450 (-) Transcript_21717:38-1387(-)